MEDKEKETKEETSIDYYEENYTVDGLDPVDWEEIIRNRIEESKGRHR